VIDAQGNFTADSDTISCPALQKLCQDPDEVTEQLFLEPDQVTHLSECMFKEGDRHISRSKIAEIVMKVHNHFLFGPEMAALEEVRKQSVLQYFLDSTYLSQSEKMRPTTKYGLLRLTSGRVDPRAVGATEVALSARLSEMFQLGLAPTLDENPVVVQQQQMLQQHNNRARHSVAPVGNPASDPLVPPGFE
jgi:hypothetical protein